MNRRPFRAVTGFTLTELLVVIAIIAVLAAILLPVFSGIRRSGDRTKCLANLRQIGAAIGSYTADHDGYLPGPLWTMQTCWYSEDDFGTMATVLAPYLGLVADSEKKVADVFVCPSWQKGGPYREDDLFVLNTAVMLDGNPVNPWGDADLDPDEGQPTPAGAIPLKLASLADASPAQTWAMQELDSLSAFSNIPRGIAPKPVHGEIRNALFFDFHVAPIPVQPKP